MSTPENVNGYNERNIINKVNKHGVLVSVIVEEDDCFRYSKENEIAFQLLIQMIDSNLHHFIQEEVLDKDSKRIYRILNEHFAGH